MTEADATELAQRIADTYQREQSRLDLLAQRGIKPSEEENIALVRSLARDFHGTLRRFRSQQKRDEILELASEFLQFGAKGVLLAGSQRGGDFLNNQLRGRWAEQVVHSMRLPNTEIVSFGPSGAAMPGEDDHLETTITFREITLVEGKRPDLLAFDSSVWASFGSTEREMTQTWPKRTLAVTDAQLVKSARYGIEVKNSTWHYGTRRDAGGGPLSITVKAEEVDDLKAWQQATGLPLLFFQVLFDEIYCMSFRRMLDSVGRGHVYSPGDYELDGRTGAAGKVYHRFRLANFEHLCAKVVFPAESIANVRVLADGSVIPYIDFRPARATDLVPDAVNRELAYSLATG